MLRSIFLSFLLLSASRFIGQTITISEELPLRNDYTYTILGWVGEDLLLFRDRGHEFFIQAFDEEMHLKWEREILLGPRRADIIGVVAQQDQFHLLFAMRDKGNYILQHRSYDHAVNLIDTMTIDIVESIFMTPKYMMAESEDKSKVLLFREINNGLNLCSYDLNTRQLLWKHEFEFTGGNLHRDYTPMEVSNEGQFYLVLEPDKFLQKVQNLELFSSQPGSAEVFHETLDLGAFQAYDFHAQYDNLHDHLIITGLYSDRNVSRAEGFYLFQYQPGATHVMHMLPFDESLLAEVHGKDVSTSRGLTDFNVKKVALRQDGGAVLIAELNKEFSRRSSLPVRRENGSFTRGGWVDYYYEDLILFAVHPDGTEHWKKVLHKRQYSQDDEAMYSSFFLFKSPARLRFLFNDEIKQENTVGGYEVTGTGYVERKTVFNTDYQKLKLRFKDGLQVAYNECIVPSERNNRLNLVRIKYE
ncbi:MAG TPA: hypothetical protein VMZ69_06270 [Saprospiraceae bacterium]|nr:hypothetical protein [Saprospiraceae bacterium]